MSDSIEIHGGMKYLGGKHTIGKEISEFMTKHVNPESVNGYLEPFCGSLGVFKFMTDYNFKKLIASDFQPDIIQMWKEAQNNTLELPDSIDEQYYNKLKKVKSPNALKAVAGFGLSFGGVFFQSYSQKYSGTSGRNFYNEFKNSLNKIIPKIQRDNITFHNKSYHLWTPDNMLVYCDPPYQNTAGYSTGSFDHDKFWNTIRKWSKKNYVFVSEETAPKDFICVWEKKKFRTISSKNRKYKSEKIFVHSEGLLKDLKQVKNTVKKNKTLKKSVKKNKTLKKRKNVKKN